MNDKTKRCSVCNTEKSLDLFVVNKNRKDNVASHCKKCDTERNKRKRRTKEGCISKIYTSQKQSSKKRNMRLPEYTKQELRDWLMSQQLFHRLYSEWKESGYKKRLVPSVDRKEDSVHYCMSNIRLMTWNENRAKSFVDRLNGDSTICISVDKLTLDGAYICSYKSMSIAARDNDIRQGNIHNCCEGRNKSAGGFKWKYKGEI